ncbi:hypothetical protein D3C80_1848540 [compost metagenome]
MKNVIDAARPDFITNCGIGAFRLYATIVERWQFVTCRDHRPAIDVNAQIIERLRNRLVVFRMDGRQEIAVKLQHVLRIGALENGI